MSAVKQRRAHELVELARTVDYDGLLVKARCFHLVAEDEPPRVEIHLEAMGLRAIYDCAEIRENRVAREINSSMRCFATAVRYRTSQPQ